MHDYHSHQVAKTAEVVFTCAQSSFHAVCTASEAELTADATVAEEHHQTSADHMACIEANA